MDGHEPPVLTSNGGARNRVNNRRKTRRWQFLVWWVGFGPEDNEWLSLRMLEDCEALDR